MDWEKFEEEHGPLCPDCLSHHKGGPCSHNKHRPCRYCTREVGALSTGGPDVCALCEVYGVPPDVFTGQHPPYDFHSERKNSSLIKQAIAQADEEAEDDIIYLGEPVKISKEAMEDLKRAAGIEDLSHLISFDDYWEEDKP